MPYGEIFMGTFAQIWRHKRLWLFGLLGVLISSVGLAIYQLFQARWQSDWFGMMERMAENPDVFPQGLASDMLSKMAWLWAGLGLLLVCTLLGYVVNLIMRGATMNEAAIAWAGGSTQTGRGISTGAGRVGLRVPDRPSVAPAGHHSGVWRRTWPDCVASRCRQRVGQQRSGWRFRLGLLGRHLRGGMPGVAHRLVRGGLLPADVPVCRGRAPWPRSGYR